MSRTDWHFSTFSNITIILWEPFRKSLCLCCLSDSFANLLLSLLPFNLELFCFSFWWRKKLAVKVPFSQLSRSYRPQVFYRIICQLVPYELFLYFSAFAERWAPIFLKNFCFWEFNLLKPGMVLLLLPSFENSIQFFQNICLFEDLMKNQVLFRALAMPEKIPES